GGGNVTRERRIVKDNRNGSRGKPALLRHVADRDHYRPSSCAALEFAACAGGHYSRDSHQCQACCVFFESEFWFFSATAAHRSYLLAARNRGPQHSRIALGLNTNRTCRRF